MSISAITRVGTAPSFHSYSRKILSAVDDGKIEGAVPTLVIAEILTGYFTNKRDTEAEEFLSTSSTNKNLKIVPMSTEIAMISSKIRAFTGLRLPDAVVLGTAVQWHADFLVTNDELFPKVLGNLKVLDSRRMVANLND